MNDNRNRGKASKLTVTIQVTYNIDDNVKATFLTSTVRKGIVLFVSTTPRFSMKCLMNFLSQAVRVRKSYEVNIFFFYINELIYDAISYKS